MTYAVFEKSDIETRAAHKAALCLAAHEAECARTKTYSVRNQHFLGYERASALLLLAKECHGKVFLSVDDCQFLYAATQAQDGK